MAISDEVDKNTQNTGLESLRLAVQMGYDAYGMVDGFGDVFTTTSGATRTSSTNEVYSNPSDYFTSGSESHSLLIQSETSAGSTTFTDTTGTHTVLNEGSPQHSTTQAKFGSSAMYFDGSSNLTVADHADFNWGTGDFTYELWVWVDTVGATQSFSSQENTSGGAMRHLSRIVATGEFRFEIDTDGSGTGTIALVSSSTISAQTWTHLAVVNDSGTLKMYINGTQEDTISAGGGCFTGASQEVNIGGRNLTASRNWMTGYIEEFSIIKGEARYTEVDETQNIPDAPYQTGTNNMTLIGAPQTASEAPTTARAILLYDPIDSATLNTDATLEVSMDGGSTYSTAFTLEKNSDYDANVEIIETDNLTLDSTSGTSMVYRFKTLNSKEIRLHGIYLQWA